MAYFFEYLIDLFSPDKGLGLLIVDLEEFFNSGDEFWNASEYASSDSLAG